MRIHKRGVAHLISGHGTNFSGTLTHALYFCFNKHPDHQNFGGAPDITHCKLSVDNTGKFIKFNAKRAGIVARKPWSNITITVALEMS